MVSARSDSLWLQVEHENSWYKKADSSSYTFHIGADCLPLHSSRLALQRQQKEGEDALFSYLHPSCRCLLRFGQGGL